MGFVKGLLVMVSTAPSAAYLISPAEMSAVLWSGGRRSSRAMWALRALKSEELKEKRVSSAFPEVGVTAAAERQMPLVRVPVWHEEHASKEEQLEQPGAHSTQEGVPAWAE